MTALAIVLLSTAASILYGVVHDQITIRLCPEYFTVFHPPVFPTDDLTLLALGWGVLATFWAGAAMGVVLAVAARAGSRPPLPVRRLVRPIALLLGVMALSALAAGLLGAHLGRTGRLAVGGDMATRLPPSKHPAFLADLWAHNASYLVGVLGAVFLGWRLFRSRRLPPAAPPTAAGPAAPPPTQPSSP